MGSGKKESRRPPRPRGRPPIGGKQLAEKQAGVIEAAGHLLAEKSSSDITVEQLVQAAGTSRPTLYRWFPDGLEQVFEMLNARAHADLLGRIVTVVAREEGIQERLVEGTRAYFEWGLDMGPVAFGLYRECFEVDSIAWRYRQQSVAAVITVLRAQANLGGLEHVTDLEIETFVGWIEGAGAALFRRYPVSRTEAERQLWLTTEMVLAMLEIVRQPRP